ncbi:MAG: hypothetical protein V3T58_06290 [Candidatus Hydrothermarchaeales archaeon]
MIAIAHDRDVDGLACHAILRRYCFSSDRKIRHIFADYTDLCLKVEGIRGSRGEEIVIADLGFSEPVAGCLPLLKELAKDNEVKWFDHHDWSGVKIPRSIKLHVDMEHCAAELVAGNYMPRDDVALKLAALARAQDFMEKNNDAWRLYDVISAGFDKLHLVKLLAKGVFWNIELETCYRDYQEVKDQGFVYLKEHSKYYRIGEWMCLMGYSKDELSSTIASTHLLEKKSDFAICTWPNGKMSFRRNNPEIDLKKIAALFKGGGRETAAGGHYEGEVTEEDYLRVFDAIMERISRSYEELNGFRS